MLKYQLPDGTNVSGRNYADIVRAMASMKLSKPQSLASYRRVTAQRALDMYGKKIDDSSNKSFVQDLLANDLLYPQDEPAS